MTGFTNAGFENDEPVKVSGREVSSGDWGLGIGIGTWDWGTFLGTPQCVGKVNVRIMKLKSSVTEKLRTH